jgi:hypothetical protein
VAGVGAMKSLKTFPGTLLLFAVLLLPWATVQALENFEQFGVIKSLSSGSFTVRGQTYRLTPGARIDSNDVNRRQLSDFKKGDQIYFEGKILNDAYLIDLIVYQTPIPE